MATSVEFPVIRPFLIPLALLDAGTEGLGPRIEPEGIKGHTGAILAGAVFHAVLTRHHGWGWRRMLR